jgi:acyl-CoA synthetase (AMP-forming)/AMP-acid ligase II/acyl carrier protein
MCAVPRSNRFAADRGPPLLIAPGTPESVAANLAARVAQRPDGIIRSYGLAGLGRSQSYAETWHRSGRILAGMGEFGIAPGQIVVLLIDDVVDFVPAYWACVRGGFIVAPLVSAARDRQRSRNALGQALNRLSNAILVADEAFAAVATDHARRRGLRVLPLRISESNGGREGEDGPHAEPLCLIPSSGSTGDLKLVALSHGSVLNRHFADRFEKQAAYLGTVALDSVSAAQHGIFLRYGSWTQISPMALTAQPTFVLDAIERHQITAAGCTPSTAKTIVAAAQRSGRKWRLGSLDEFGVGAETVAIKTMRTVGEFLEQSGSSRRIITARYGTTETGFLVTGSRPFKGTNYDDDVVLLGSCAPGVELRLVVNDTVVVEDEIGEVQVNCPQRIFSSYWGEPEATRQSFTGDGWWRTGDLGRLRGGMLSVHGRAKDVLVVSGKKFSLAEIDTEIETVLSAGGRAFSCAVHWPGEANERLAVVVAAEAEDYREKLFERIRAAVGRRFGLRVDPVIGVALDTLPLAANGKLRRSELADRVRRGLLGSADRVVRRFPALQSIKEKKNRSDVEKKLLRIWKEALNLRGDVDKHANFLDLGGDSLRSLMLYTAIEEQFGQQIAAEDFFASPTFADLLRLVLRGGTPSGLPQTPSSRITALVDELETAYAADRTPAFRRASPNRWGNACHALWEAGRIEIVEFAARALHEKFPGLDYFRTLVAYFDALPSDPPPALAFADDPAAEIQIVGRPNCDKVILCFCAMNGTLGLPLNFVHQWLGRLPASLVYIKDFRNLRGGCGFPTLGPDRDSAITAFRRVANNLGAINIYTLGVSLGGFAALYYGLELKASAVLSLAGATDHTPSFVRTLGPVSDDYLEMCERAPEYASDLSGPLTRACNRPRVLLVYSDRHSDDRRQAERIAGLSRVKLIAVHSAHHNVVDPLVRERTLLPLLQEFLSGVDDNVSEE